MEAPLWHLEPPVLPDTRNHVRTSHLLTVHVAAGIAEGSGIEVADEPDLRPNAIHHLLKNKNTWEKMEQYVLHERWRTDECRKKCRRMLGYPVRSFTFRIGGAYVGKPDLTGREAIQIIRAALDEIATREIRKNGKFKLSRHCHVWQLRHRYAGV